MLEAPVPDFVAAIRTIMQRQGVTCDPVAARLGWHPQDVENALQKSTLEDSVKILAALGYFIEFKLRPIEQFPTPELKRLALTFACPLCGAGVGAKCFPHGRHLNANGRRIQRAHGRRTRSHRERLDLARGKMLVSG